MANQVENELTAKIGPLPAWAWGGLVVLASILYSAYRKRSAAAAAAAATTTTDPTDPSADPSTDLTQAPTTAADTYDPFSQLAVTDPAYPVGAMPSGVPGPITNIQWSKLAANYLMAHGDDPTLVQNALSKYVNGGSLSAAEQAIIDGALTAFGSPPEGTLALTPVTDPTPTPPTGTSTVPTGNGTTSVTPTPMPAPVPPAAPAVPVYGQYQPTYDTSVYTSAPGQPTAPYTDLYVANQFQGFGVPTTPQQVSALSNALNSGTMTIAQLRQQLMNLGT